ncbi:MAG: sigma 54-interacting transcriptional regulator [bacterium]
MAMDRLTEEPPEPIAARNIGLEIILPRSGFSELEDLAMNLERRSRFYEKLIRSLPGVFYLFDDHLRFLSWNKNLETVTGYTKAELSAKKVPDLFAGDSRMTIEKAIRAGFKDGETVVEAEFTTKDGRSVPFFFTGVSTTIDETSYVVGMGTDLTELKLAENSLRESEELYRTLAERMTVGVLLYHSSSIVFGNQAFASMFGFKDVQDLLRKDMKNIASGGFQKTLNELLVTLESGGSKESSFETCWITLTGREVWIDGRATLTRWKNVPTVLLTARDITEAKLREKRMAEEAEHLRRENVHLRSSIKDRYRMGEIIGKSPAMQEVYELVVSASSTDANVILYGESGTGKELVARAIHRMGRRSQKPFVPVNCAAVPENLLESEFFGYKKGAFTHAQSEKPGYLDMAHGGTLFLDEVGDLSLSLQAKLLRAIEGGGYLPVGGTAMKYSDFRVIAATNRNLLERVKKGDLREDFFYRIHVIPIELPPLKHRKEDIALLLEHFLKMYADGKKIPSMPGHVIEAFLRYDWPGNVRELQNAVQRYLAVKRLEFTPSSILEPRCTWEDSRARAERSPGPHEAKLVQKVESAEKDAIQRALDLCQGKKGMAARALGVSRKTLFRKMKRLEIS